MSEQIPDDVLRTMIQWRNDTIIQQIESENENNRRLAGTQPMIVKQEYFVKLQMNIVYFYMRMVSHENRYIFERLLHIFWILAMLGFCQFHLLHISNFSYIKCMSDQIVESLEDPSFNHTYAYKNLSDIQSNQVSFINYQDLVDTRAGLDKDINGVPTDMDPQQFQLSPQLIDKIYIKTLFVSKCSFDENLDILMELQRRKEKTNLKIEALKASMMKYQYQTNHTYFKEFFNKTTDVLVFRIVDQIAALNQETYILKKDTNNSNQSSTIENESIGPKTLESFILLKEMKGDQSMIKSNDKEDIMRTIRLLNDSYANSTQNTIILADQEINSINDSNNSLDFAHQFMTKSARISTNFLSGLLMNDNAYAFSYNQDLLELTVDELSERDDVRLSYVQVDNMNKCVPQDWFLGYDQFAVYTFHKLSGQIKDQGGYLKTSFRKGYADLIRDDQIMRVDFSKDFKGNLDQGDQYFYLNYIWQRFLCIFFTFFDLGLCYAVSSFGSQLFQNLIFEVSQEPTFRLNATKLLGILLVVVILWILPLTFTHSQNPFSTNLIAYTCLFSYNFSQYALQHSRYQTKYKFWMFMGSFLNYSYQLTYPYCNVRLANLVFLFFTLYQFLHNLFKFSYHLEMIFFNLQRGTLAAVLPAYIQNELQQRSTSRTISRQLETQREEEERQSQQDNRAMMEVNRQQRLVQMEQSLRDTLRNENNERSESQIENEVQEQMGQVRSAIQSGQYTEVLDQFSNLLHRPSQVMRQAQDSARNQEGHQDSIGQHLSQFQSYTEEVNRQISSINNLLQSMSTNLQSAEQNIINEQTRNSHLSTGQISSRRETQNQEVPPRQQPVNQMTRSINTGAEAQEPSLPRFTLGDVYSRPNQATGIDEQMQGGAYHSFTPTEVRVQNRVRMRAFDLGSATSAEQHDCINCACFNCFKMFMASVRHIQSRNERREAFEQMSSEDMQLQLRLLNKQLSMAIELLGTDFILNRASRNREYEALYGRDSSQYTEVVKKIDDMHEICDLIQLSRLELRNQRMSNHNLRALNSQSSSSAELIRRLQDPNYKCKTLDDIYGHRRDQSQQNQISQREQRAAVPLLITRSTSNNQNQSDGNQTQSSLTSLSNTIQSRLNHISQEEEYIRVQDWLPIIQVLVVNLTGLNDNNAYVKKAIKFEDGLDPANRRTKGDVRYFHQNPTYVLTFRNDQNINDQVIRFMSSQLQQLGLQSIWRDPKKYKTDPIEIGQLNQFMNLKLKLQFGEALKSDSDIIVGIERLCMTPIATSSPSPNKPIDQTLKYGTNKDIQSSVAYIRPPPKKETRKPIHVDNNKKGGSKQELIYASTSSRMTNEKPDVEEQKVSSDEISARLQSQKKSEKILENPSQSEGKTRQKNRRSKKKSSKSGIGQQLSDQSSSSSLLTMRQEETKVNTTVQSEQSETGLGGDEVVMMLEYFNQKMQNIMESQQKASQVCLQQLQSQMSSGDPGSNQQQIADDQSASDEEGFVIANINPDLLLLQNQINEAAFALRIEDSAGQKIPITDEHIRSNPGKLQQIQNFQRAFFNEHSVNVSCFQAAQMNKDEASFLKQTVKNHLDIIQLFPALYPLQSQMMVLQLLKQRDRTQSRNEVVAEQRRNLEREILLAHQLLTPGNNQQRGQNNSRR